VHRAQPRPTCFVRQVLLAILHRKLGLPLQEMAASLVVGVLGNRTQGFEQSGEYQQMAAPVEADRGKGGIDEHLEACRLGDEPQFALLVVAQGRRKLATSQPTSSEGKIISELAKMIGMTPPWFTRRGR